MAWSNFYQGNIGELLSKWEQAGVFSYVLPFLILFALISAILNNLKVFKENRMITVIIAFAVSLMALQFDFVPRFFAEVFPRLGVGLAVILVVLIILGFFIKSEEAGFKYSMVGIGVIIAIVVLVSSGGSMGSGIGNYFNDNWDWIILIMVGVAAFIAVVLSLKKKETP